MKEFEKRLTGGHPNSLGNTIEIVEEVLAEPGLFDALFHSYFSDDEVVRLRVSSAMKRICKENRGLLIPYIDRFLGEIAMIDQPSTHWTMAQLFAMLDRDMSGDQFVRAKNIVRHYLEQDTDWIVLNTAMESLFNWSKKDIELRGWLTPHLHRLSEDKRNSVSKRAKKYLSQMA